MFAFASELAVNTGGSACRLSLKGCLIQICYIIHLFQLDKGFCSSGFQLVSSMTDLSNVVVYDSAIHTQCTL